MFCVEISKEFKNGLNGLIGTPFNCSVMGITYTIVCINHARDNIDPKIPPINLA